MLTLLADCEAASAGSWRFVYFILALALLLAWAGGIAALVGTSDEQVKTRMSIVPVVGAVAGGFVFLFPHGVSGNGNYLDRFWISLVVAIVVGGLFHLVPPRRNPFRSIALAILGDLFIPGGVILLLLVAVAGGGCPN
jgi:peptidoglycan/LPS O-acetylase OafA/YrhL